MTYKALLYLFALERVEMMPEHKLSYKSCIDTALEISFFY